MQEVLIPKLGGTVEEVSIVEWLKAEGDLVAAGEVLCTLQTDKAVIEYEAEVTGVVRKILLPPDIAAKIQAVVQRPYLACNVRRVASVSFSERTLARGFHRDRGRYQFGCCISRRGWPDCARRQGRTEAEQNLLKNTPGIAEAMAQ